jgi:hypothetical protein
LGGRGRRTVCDEKIEPEETQEEDGGSGGARTRHKSNEYGPEKGLPSQIASQEPGTVGHDVARVVTAWAKLPAPLKAAILAIVDSVLTVNGGDK